MKTSSVLLMLLAIFVVGGFLTVGLIVRQQDNDLVMLQGQINVLKTRIEKDEKTNSSQQTQIRKLYRNEGKLSSLIVEIIEALTGSDDKTPTPNLSGS